MPYSAVYQTFLSSRRIVSMAQTLHDLYQVYTGLCQQRRMSMTENMGVYMKTRWVIHKPLNTVYTSLYETLGKRMNQ